MITQTEINIVNQILSSYPIENIKDIPKSTAIKLLKILKMFKALTDKQLKYCFCNISERMEFYNDFNIEWNNKNIVIF